MMSIRKPHLLVFLALLASTSAAAQPGARAVIERAHAAAGGELWRRPETLTLKGSALLCQAGRCQAAESYAMWRVFPRESRNAHVANGQVRIDASSGGRVLFQTSFDGVDTYNQAGLVPGAQASREWSENFGFGIIRFALDPGFTLKTQAQESVDGYLCDVVEVSDPGGTQTTFAFDRADASIRRVGFQTTRGWHVRIYSDFLKLASGFMQPQRVRLYYDGVLSNDIWWQEITVNQPIDPKRFQITP